MALDLRKSRKDYPDRNKWFLPDYVEKMKLKKDAIVQSVFYSRDLGDFKTQSISSGSVKMIEESGTIETPDFIADIKADCFVLYNGNLWLVVDVLRESTNKEKYFSKRPSCITKITIKRRISNGK